MEKKPHGLNAFEVKAYLWKYGSMKTTIEIPDAMFRQAKALAAARGVTLRRLFTEALEDRLRRHTHRERTGNAEPPWMAGFGALSDLSDENRRILDVIGEEFERLSPEDLS